MSLLRYITKKKYLSARVTPVKTMRSQLVINRKQESPKRNSTG